MGSLRARTGIVSMLLEEVPDDLLFAGTVRFHVRESPGAACPGVTHAVTAQC